MQGSEGEVKGVGDGVGRHLGWRLTVSIEGNGPAVTSGRCVQSGKPGGRCFASKQVPHTTTGPSGAMLTKRALASNIKAGPPPHTGPPTLASETVSLSQAQPNPAMPPTKPTLHCGACFHLLALATGQHLRTDGEGRLEGPRRSACGGLQKSRGQHCRCRNSH